MDENNCINGAVQEAGNISVFVPEGYTVSTGTNMGDPDDDQVWFHVTPPTFFNYYWIMAHKDEDSVDNSLSMTKSINQGEDLDTFSTGDIQWSGVIYQYNDLPCNVLKGICGDEVFQVTIIGHELASEEVQKVLASIKLK